ncbi:MAG: EAL domain-containing protein [bacterium]|nr:EAL domain-containing protein [bacterium]
MTRNRILIVEDDPVQKVAVARHLQTIGYTAVASVESGAEAVEQAGALQPDLILMDISLNGEMDGIEAADRIRQEYRIPIVFATTHTDRATFLRAKKTQPFGYLVKPFNREELQIAIEMALMDHSVEQHLSETMAEMNIILENVPAGVVLLQRNRIFRLNRAFEDCFELSRSQAIGRPVSLLFKSPIQYRTFVRRIREELHQRGIFHEEIELRSGTGETRWCRVTGRVIHPEDPRSPSVWIINDVTDSRRAEEYIKLSARVFENTLEGVWIADRLQNIIQVNRAFTEITGYDEDQAMGQNPGFLNSGRHDPGFYLDIWTELNEKGRWEGEIWNRRRDGEVYPEWLSISVVRDDDGRVSNYIGVFSDISKRKEFEERLSYMATHDTLTDLPNRFLFRETLQQSLKKARRNKAIIGVCFINLNRFKAVNEALGHQTGDEVLRQVGRRLRQIVRSEDMVARAGGDEFVLILEDLSSSERAVVAINRIMDTLREPIRVEHLEVHIGASIGVSVYPHDTDDWQSLTRFAEAAMQQARERGRNNYQFFTPEINKRAVERIALENNLRRAIDRDELSVQYQPIVDADRGAIAGYEALLRWTHPERGPISPAVFIPLAEEMGLIIPIGSFVLRAACFQLSELHKNGRADQFMSVNLSAHQLHDPNLGPTVREALDDSGIPPGALHLEITETAAMQNTDTAIHLLGQLSELGIHISLDDFGTGYSSLGHLKRLPIDCIKIDRSFVLELPGSNESKAIVEAIHALARALKLRTIVEGVETREQMEYLRGLGLDRIQGFYFSRPLPAGDLQSFKDSAVESKIAVH